MNLSQFEIVEAVHDLQIQPELRITTSTHAPLQDALYEGHFPGLPIFPGVLQLEFMAQSCGFMYLLSKRFETMPILVGIEAARFREPVKPGTRLECQAQLTHVSERLLVCSAKVSSKEAFHSSCSVRLTLGAFPNVTMLDYMRRTIHKAVQRGELTHLLEMNPG